MMAKSLVEVYARYLSIFVLTLVVSLFLVSFSFAAVRTVTNLSDGGPGSLRDIVDNVAMPGDDIVFDPSIAGGTINLTSALLIGIELTITGPPDNPITLDGNNNTRLITLFNDNNVVLSNLVFVNALVEGTMNMSGGAIGATSFPFTSLEVNNCTFRNNSVQCTGTSCQARGAAIVAVADLIVRGSTFDSNFTHCTVTNQFCFARGGAIEHQGIGQLVLENNTFYNNQVRCTGIGSSTCGLEGGALYVDNDSNELNNNTFSHNNILCDSETCNLLGSTIFVRETSVALNVLNTIIDNEPGVSVPNCSGAIADNGNNIQFPGNSCGASIQIAQADLGPLADNGGITQTQAINQGSPAFNNGNNATCLDIDQRGVSRPQAIFCDIGAYELIVGDITHNVPTLSEWGLIAMAGVLGIVGYMVARRRKIAA